MRRRSIWIFAALAVLCSSATNAQQHYPTRTVRVVVFLPAGGAGDVTARIVAQKMSDAFGQNFLVDNRPGMGGVIGTGIVAKAPPDGYTLLACGITTHGIGPHIYSNLPYDPVRDFAPVVLSSTMPIFLLVNAQVPVKTVSDLIALAKAKPESINFASPGTGSAPHLVGELFKTVTGIPSQHIPYKGSGTAAPDLVGGHVQFMFDAIAGHLAGVQSGRVKAMAVTGPSRVAAFPDTPTMAEVGLPRVTGSVWYGLLAPAGTPTEIISKLNAEANRILAMQEVKDRMAVAGMYPAGGTPEEFGKFIRDELAKWGPIVKAAGVKVD
ncbi:MAG TPA: tripartite tricarboxylate transporter substrate binding protein [Burkholderiales bacterium]|nr:tripartite tricarboxylate transporter substrate binding protein [Burkholderiales bacterium]